MANTHKKHQQDIFFCSLLHLKRINVLQRSVILMKLTDFFFFVFIRTWSTSAREREKWSKRETNHSQQISTTALTLCVPTSVPIFVFDAFVTLSVSENCSNSDNNKKCAALVICSSCWFVGFKSLN